MFPPGFASRRQFLRGGLALGAFVLPASFPPAAAPIRPARAGGVIVLLLEGGMSHLESWDPKPAAPREIRGEFAAIATSVPGLRVCEHLPLLARQAHLYNVIRSVHCDARNDHSPGMHLALTGHENVAAGVALERANFRHPSQGSLLAHLLGVTAPGGVPRFVAVPRRTQLAGQVSYAGPAFLGTAHEAFEAGDLPPALLVPQGGGLRRLQDRQALKATFDGLQTALGRDPAVGRLDAHYQRAWQMLSGQRLLRALDLGCEPAAIRDRYGGGAVGQALVLARRLVEAGVTYVLVDPYSGNTWDTHAQNFAGHKALLPPMDRAVAALLTDLEQRGLLDEVLLLVISELGRTPVVNAQAGRDHWTSAYSVMLAGGGLTRGQVLGSTTAGGQYPGSRPVTVPEIVATVYRQLGIDSETVVYDPEGRPYPILPPARPIAELIA
jgi:uncharacterized protein (DUF1501 family)